jgi:hypothetical protein
VLLFFEIVGLQLYLEKHDSKEWVIYDPAAEMKVITDSIKLAFAAQVVEAVIRHQSQCRD